MSGSLQPLPRAYSHLIKGLLLDKRVRTREGAFVVEGAKFCRDLISSHPDSIISLLLSSSYLSKEDSTERSVRAGISRQFICTDAAFAKLSDVDTPQGILAVVRHPQWDAGGVWRHGRVLGFYGDRLRDPLNVGAMIRTAAALNLTAVWLSPDSADCFGPKVVRAAAGSLLSIPIFTNVTLPTIVDSGCVLYSAVTASPTAVDLRSIHTVPPRLLLALGNEGQGLSEELLKVSAMQFSIPMARAIESLNVASTAAICAFHFSGLPVMG